jgi:NAD(P)-dependent dehydrogenase (short-subunit alcohol dehydrogenase family)
MAGGGLSLHPEVPPLAVVAVDRGRWFVAYGAPDEAARRGIRINAVCPGVIETPMVERATHGRAEEAAQFAAAEPVGRMGTPDEVAGAVLWLSSDEASFVTGQALAVDGGWVAQ